MEYTLITGASSGIGLELATLMAERGHNLILVARRKNILLEKKAMWEKKYGIAVEALGMDLSAPGQARTLYETCLGHAWQVDILVNNAGFGDYAHFDPERMETYRQMLQLNVTTLTELTGLFLVDMKQRSSGRILNLGSLAAFMPVPNMAVYAASKAYVMHFTEALNYELRGTGITATVLSPGVTETGFVGRSGMGGAAVMKIGAMDARSVAQAGYEAMMAGRLNAVPGWKNRLSAVASMLTPSREILLRIAGKIFDSTGAPA